MVEQSPLLQQESPWWSQPIIPLSTARRKDSSVDWFLSSRPVIINIKVGLNIIITIERYKQTNWQRIIGYRQSIIAYVRWSHSSRRSFSKNLLSLFTSVRMREILGFFLFSSHKLLFGMSLRSNRPSFFYSLTFSRPLLPAQMALES